jgi:soluble lytic murein transglycosylase-like protein
MKKMLWTALVLFLPAFTHTGPCRADIYKYIDSSGVVHFTNVPTSSNYKLYIKEKSERETRPVHHTAYDSIIKKASSKYGVDFSLVKAVIQVESGFDPGAVSRKGAKGLMQIMPQNYTSLNVTDPFDPSQNIMGGTLYLKQLIHRYNNKLPLVLAAYNAGPNAVDRYRSIPPFSETRRYVEKVMRIYSTIKKT